MEEFFYLKGMKKMTRKEYSELLVPNVEHDYNYYEAKYPKRDIKEGQMVTSEDTDQNVKQKMELKELLEILKT